MSNPSSYCLSLANWTTWCILHQSVIHTCSRKYKYRRYVSTGGADTAKDSNILSSLAAHRFTNLFLILSSNNLPWFYELSLCPSHGRRKFCPHKSCISMSPLSATRKIGHLHTIKTGGTAKTSCFRLSGWAHCAFSRKLLPNLYLPFFINRKWMRPLIFIGKIMSEFLQIFQTQTIKSFLHLQAVIN